ncbi:hypothetical protein BJV82DRAFT_661325 [Fennellomyces sp. T-0311]|nr:hypothetical protein BJV82DRAFT_661325 [Fennellomyces sp. T-0311]
MGANQSKAKGRRTSNNKSRQLPQTTPSATSLSSSPQPLRPQQLQQQRQSHHHFEHNRQIDHQMYRSPYNHHRPSSSTPKPLLIEDDDNSTYERRLSIDFYSNDTMSSAILIKSHIVQESSVSDRLPSDPPEYVPPTISSTSSTNSVASTSLFSTASSPSSMSSVSSLQSKFAPATSSPALIHVLERQRRSSTAHGHSDKPLALSSSRTTISETDISTLVTSSNDDTTLVPQIDEQRYRELVDLVQRKKTEAYYSLAICQYYGQTPSRKPNYVQAFKWFQAAAKEYKTMLNQPHHQQEREQILGVISSSQYCLGDMLANGKGVALDVAKSAKYFNAAAKIGYTPAQYMAGYYCEHGTAGYQNIKEAEKWYNLAAAKGYAKAQAALGSLLVRQTDDLETDQLRNERSKQALHWLYSAAEQEGQLVNKSRQKAFEYYERFLDGADSADFGVTHYMMGVNYRHGDRELKRNDTLALKHFHLSAESGFAQAQRVLGNMYADGIGVRKNESEAHRLFQRAAAQGDALAQCWLGKQYQHGRGCLKNTQRAINCYKKVAQSNNMPILCIPAQLALALLLDEANRRQDALEWFRKVAASGDLKQGLAPKELESMFMHKLSLYRNTARLQIALYQLHGYGGLQRDPVTAFQLLRDLADTEDFPDAHFRIARALKEGIADVVDSNPKLAYDYFRKAADLGHMLSQFHAADMLSNGFTYVDNQGVTRVMKDREQAYYLYAAAASQGHELSQACEAVYHIEGLPPANKDLARAEELLRSAATRGLPEAMVTLARMLVNDPNNATEAHMWLLKAEAKNDTSAMRELASAYEMDLIPVTLGKTNYQEGFERLKKAAVSFNDPRAWFRLAQYYEKGWFVDVSVEKQLECLQRAEELGYTRASFAIANLYEGQSERNLAFLQYNAIIEKYNLSSQYGWHARLNSCRLVVLHGLRDQKEQCNVYAMLQEMVEYSTEENAIEPFELLGICCENGIGTTCNITQATNWYRRAVDVPIFSSVHWAQDRARARLAKLLIDEGAHTEALRHLQHLGPRLDQMKGNQEFSETITQAREARYYLGYLLLHGNGIRTNVRESKRWLTVAADQGHGAAAYELGLLAVQEGNDFEARLRFSQGDAHGHAGSKRELAMLYCQEHQNDDPDDMADDGSQWDSSEIKYLLEDAIMAGDAEAWVQLGLLHEMGFGSAFPKDMFVALEYYNEAIALGHLSASIYKAEVYDSLDQHHEAVKWYNKHPTHWIAQFRLAAYQLQGLGGITENNQLGFNHLQKILESTSAPLPLHERKTWSTACILLGQCYKLGIGTQQNLKCAVAWYARGADLEKIKNTEAMLLCGQLYDQLGEQVDALEWYRRAADQKNTEAEYQIGLFHRDGLADLEPNLVAAARYFTTAKNRGHAQATYELAHIYWRQEEYTAAWELYKKAAEEQHVVDSLRALGFLYHNGFSKPDKTTRKLFEVAQNHTTAFRYFCRAAELDDGISIAMVGSYYQEGYLPFSGDNMEIALECYEKAYQHPESQKNRPILQLVIGRLIHIMANECTNASHAMELHNQAYVWFDKAVHEPEGVQTSYAQMMVALYHLHGWYAPEHDPETGFRQLNEIETGTGEIEVFKEVTQHIARCYEDGLGVDQDYNEALKHWQRIVELGDEQALERVEDYYHKGRATGDDLSSAQRSYEAAKATEETCTTISTGSSYGGR